MTPKTIASSRGFSLLEALASTAILVVLSSATLSGLLAYQRAYSSLELKADMHSGLRGAAEMLSQEIGQAGKLSYAGTTLSSTVIGGPTAQLQSVASTTNIFTGEQLLIDAGLSQEIVTVTAVTSSSIKAVFQKSHASGTPVNGVGVFPQGVLSSSTESELQLIGDINGDGTLVYAQYDCDTTAGTVSRSVTALPAASMNPSQVVLQGLTTNPNGAPCFRYTTATAAGYTFVTSVGMTLTVQTTQIDPQTGQFIRMTNTFDNLAPRNVLAGLSLAQAGVLTQLQPTPSGVPLQ